MQKGLEARAGLPGDYAAGGFGEREVRPGQAAGTACRRKPISTPRRSGRRIAKGLPGLRAHSETEGRLRLEGSESGRGHWSLQEPFSAHLTP